MDQRLYYLEMQVKNASPADLLILLFEGLISFAEKAEINLREVEVPESRLQATQNVTRCVDILTELTGSLRPEHNPELCRTLSQLYRFFHQEFSTALSANQPDRIKAMLPLLEELKGSWIEARQLVSGLRAEAA